MMVLSKNGYEAIDAKISNVMSLVTQAMQADSSQQGAALRSVRSAIFELSSTVKTNVIITVPEDSRLANACEILKGLMRICSDPGKALGEVRDWWREAERFLAAPTPASPSKPAAHVAG